MACRQARHECPERVPSVARATAESSRNRPSRPATPRVGPRWRSRPRPWHVPGWGFALPAANPVGSRCERWAQILLFSMATGDPTKSGVERSPDRLGVMGVDRWSDSPGAADLGDEGHTAPACPARAQPSGRGSLAIRPRTVSSTDRGPPASVTVNGVCAWSTALVASSLTTRRTSSTRCEQPWCDRCLCTNSLAAKTLAISASKSDSYDQLSCPMPVPRLPDPTAGGVWAEEMLLTGDYAYATSRRAETRRRVMSAHPLACGWPPPGVRPASAVSMQEVCSR